MKIKEKRKKLRAVKAKNTLHLGEQESKSTSYQKQRTPKGNGMTSLKC